MSLMINHLKLKITTSNGIFGVDIPFERGLFILQADNTSGKSTCLLSILYALGLEGMLGPSHRMTLPPVVWERVEYEGRNYSVIESEVLLEISNSTEIITIQRQIKGNRNRNLINVWNGPSLTSPSDSYRCSSYMVREQGGATREIGFHRFLANFIDWKLPSVPKYNGEESLLYMETIFPILFIEQKHGWSSLRSRFPTYLGIKDISHRVFEFIMALDAQEIATKKISLKQQEKETKEKWYATLRQLNDISSSVDATLENVPQEPTSVWPPTIPPQVLIVTKQEVLTIQQAIEKSEQRLSSMEFESVPVVSDIVESTRQNLKEKENQLFDLEIKIRLLFEEIGQKRMQVTSIDSRLSSLESELQKNKDLKKLSELQGIQLLHTATGECPTCNQSISDSLIMPEITNHSMTVDQNIEFINEQIKLFKAMQRNESNELKTEEKKLHQLNTFIAQVRQEIRALKTTLTSQNNAPSYAFIEQKIILDIKIKELRETQKRINNFFGILSHLTEDWNSIQIELSNLPKTGILSHEDKTKISELQHSFHHQLSDYGFSSIDNFQEIQISENSYLPEYEGFEVDLSKITSAVDISKITSASDYIRFIWAYLLGLLEVARTQSSNHPGLLIMDEPRQHSANEASIKALFNRASHSSQHRQQVIIATSESDEILNRCLKNIPHKLKQFHGKIIAPL